LLAHEKDLPTAETFATVHPCYNAGNIVIFCSAQNLENDHSLLKTSLNEH